MSLSHSTSMPSASSSMTSPSSSSSPNSPVIISFDGNIGSGKSTTVKDISKFYTDKGRTDVLFIQEPVDAWNSVVDASGVPILVNYYKDKKKYAFRLQMLAYISRLSLLRNAVTKGYKYIITERCVSTDRNVFTKMLYDTGDIEHDEYNIYNQWFNEFIRDVPVNAIVYIKASPEVCLERVNIRAREGENIPIEYLRECDRYHNEWIYNETIPKLVIDADADFNKNPGRKIEILESIDQFISKL
jgi:deoxyadenosine/deoxycytidine kinase